MCKFKNIKQVLDKWCYPIGSTDKKAKKYFAQFYSNSEHTVTDFRVHIWGTIGDTIRLEYYSEFGGLQVFEGSILGIPQFINTFHVIIGSEETKPVRLYVETVSDIVPQVSWNADGTIISPYNMQLIS